MGVGQCIAAKEGKAEDGRVRVRRRRHTVFQNLVKVLQMRHDHIAVLLQYRQRHKQVEAAGFVIGPQALPQPQNIHPRELALIPHQQHAEEEEEVRAVRLLQMLPQLGVHKVHQLVERRQLRAHAGLVAQKVALHALHEVLECPEGDGVVLDDRVDGRQQVRHALDVAQLPVVLVVRQKEVLHLFHVRVGAGLGEGGVWVRVRDVFAHEDGHVAVGAVDVFFWLGCEREGWGIRNAAGKSE